MRLRRRGIALFAVALLLLLASPAWAVIAFDATSKKDDAVASGTTTFTHTFVSTTNGAVCLGVAVIGGNLFPTSAPTIDGNAMTQVGGNITISAFHGLTMWCRKSGDITAGGRTFSITFAGANTEILAVSTSYTGVNQTTPVSNPTTATGAASSSSITVTSSTGSVVVDTVAVAANGVGLAVSGPQTQRNVQQASLFNDAMGISDTAASGNVTATWSWAAVNSWGAAGASLNAASTSIPRRKVVTEP